MFLIARIVHIVTLVIRIFHLLLCLRGPQSNGFGLQVRSSLEPKGPFAGAKRIVVLSLGQGV